MHKYLFLICQQTFEIYNLNFYQKKKKKINRKNSSKIKKKMEKKACQFEIHEVVISIFTSHHVWK